jgi:hypothetical protein
MGKIESPLGERNFQSTGMRHFSVEDASGMDDGGFYPPAEQEAQPRRMTAEEAMAFREQQLRQATGGGGGGGNGGGVDPNVKRRIEMLVGIGRQTRDVPLKTERGETVFSLRTLKSKEIRYLMKIAAEMAKAESVDTIYAIREHTLALSIFAIDRVDVDIVLGTSGRPNDERLAARKALFDEMNENTLNYLYRMHEEMMDENSKLFSIKTEGDAKEVAEAIKKSSQGA